MFEFELPEKFRRYVPLAVWLIVALVILAIPLKIISYGFLPGDDALRHAAKAVSDKPWSEIIVTGKVFKIDQSLGWHGFLGTVHRTTGWDAEGLVVFSVVALFLLINGALLPWLKRPEAWLVALLAAMIISDVPQRFLLGRPFTITCTVLMTILFLAQKNPPSLKNFLLITAMLTVCTFFHGVWYLWVLPIAAFFFAGQFRWALLLTGAWLLGTFFSMLLSGHPADYLSHALQMALHGVGGHLTNRTQVTELQPFGGDILAVILVGALVALRVFTKSNSNPVGRASSRADVSQNVLAAREDARPTTLSQNPAFWLMCGCWLLAFRVGRFWEDWGWPALFVWLATEIDFLFAAKVVADSWRRLLLTVILALATFLAVTSDFSERWTKNLTWQFLSETEHPELAGWMPEPGGILYSADMSIFYQTFFKNPRGNWRYQTSYEPALMPKEDFDTFQKILWNNNDAKGYAPWVAKMKPADRLVVRGEGGGHPNIPQLEWNYGVSGIWIGRLPKGK